MSFLDTRHDVPAGVAADALPQPTHNPVHTIGPATTTAPTIHSQGAPMAVTKTSRGSRAEGKTGAPQRSDRNIKSGAQDVMVRSGNQDEGGTGVPQGFIWGLQGEGDGTAPEAGMNPVLKWGLVAALGVAIYRAARNAGIGS